MREDALAVMSRGLDIHGILLLLLRRLQQGPFAHASVSPFPSAGACTPQGGTSSGSRSASSSSSIARSSGRGSKTRVGSLAYPKLVFVLNVSEEEFEVLQTRHTQLEDQFTEREKILQAVSSLGTQARPQHSSSSQSDGKTRPHARLTQHEKQPSQSPPTQPPPSPSSSSSFVLRYIGSGGSSTCEGSATWTQRQKLYAQGGCFCVSSRVLIGDLLTGKLPPEVIDCLIVLHAESACRGFNEAFIVRLYRQRNRLGGLKALCDNPSAFFSSSLSRKYNVSIFGLLEKTLRQLCLQRLLLFPRSSRTLQRSLLVCSRGPLPLSLQARRATFL